MRPLFPFLKYLTDGTASGHEDYDSQQTLYISSLIYSTDDGAINAFKSASFNDGWIVGTNNGRSSEIHNFLTDHLGSVRMILDDNGGVTEQSDYYPFGKRWTTASTPLSDNRHRFSGKEEQAFLNLPYLDFGARMYNPDWGRWFTPDPLAHKYYAWSTYCYCIGNPIRYIDSDGRKIRENSKHLKPHMQRILNRTPTGRIQYNKMVNNKSDISIKRVKGYYVNEDGVVVRNRLGNASLTAILKDPETGEIIGGKIDITLYMGAIKDDAEERGMRVDDREAATLAEEVEHTEVENIQLQIEEREHEEKEKQETGAKVEIPYENKESEQKAHVFRDRVLRESGIEP